MDNIAIAISVLTSILQQAASLSNLLQSANAQGRDLTDEEVAQVQAGYKAAHDQLDADIAAKGG